MCNKIYISNFVKHFSAIAKVTHSIYICFLTETNIFKKYFIFVLLVLQRNIWQLKLASKYEKKIYCQKQHTVYCMDIENCGGLYLHGGTLEGVFKNQGNYIKVFKNQTSNQSIIIIDLKKDQLLKSLTHLFVQFDPC